MGGQRSAERTGKTRLPRYRSQFTDPLGNGYAQRIPSNTSENGYLISIPFLFILFQPDLGSALVIPSVVFAQLYASNLTKSFFTTAFAIFAVLVGLALLDTHRYSEYVIAKAEAKEEQVVEQPYYWIPLLKNYQRQRIMGLFTLTKSIEETPAGIGSNQ